MGQQVTNLAQSASKRRLPAGAAEQRPAGRVVFAYLDRYGDSVFGHPATRRSSGRVVAVLERAYQSISPSIRQVARAIWTGGVRLPNGDDPSYAERALYCVTVERPDGSRDEIAPAALAELGNRDNNHLLCLGTAAPAVSVAVPAGHLVDPNRDPNPDTEVAVVTASRPEPH